MNLKRILGQEHIKENLLKSIAKKNFPQSKILVDKDGYGGLNLALEIAKNLLVVDKEFKGGIFNHPDLSFTFPTFNDKQTSQDLITSWLELINENSFIDFNDWKNPSTNIQGKIRKAEIDVIFSKAHLKSFIGGAKVFIIWNVQKIDVYGQNKLLKLLEEPPEKTYFILITENLNYVLPTIISRCQISNLHPISIEDQKNFLKSFKKDINYDLIIKSSMGSISRSLKYLNADTELISHEKKFVDCLRFAFLAKKSKKAVIDLTKWVEIITSKESSREYQKEFLSYCSYMVREAMLISYKTPNLKSFISSSDFNIEKLSPFIHSKNLIQIIELIEDSHFCVSRNVNSKIVFTNFAIKLTKLINAPED
tara:strand:- start:4933 stop:6030 length:1098 start_codon:yes stop_codon:yes gene_type:complete